MSTKGLRQLGYVEGRNITVENNVGAEDDDGGATHVNSPSRGSFETA